MEMSPNSTIALISISFLNWYSNSSITQLGKISRTGLPRANSFVIIFCILIFPTGKINHVFQGVTKTGGCKKVFMCHLMWQRCVLSQKFRDILFKVSTIHNCFNCFIFNCVLNYRFSHKIQMRIVSRMGNKITYSGNSVLISYFYYFAIWN